MSAPNPAEAYERAGRKHADAALDLPFSMGDDGELAAMIEAAGFADVRVDIVEFVAGFPDAAMFVKMNAMAFGAVMPSFAAMSDAERARFVAGIEADTAEVLERHRDGNGLKFPVRANIATATAGGTAS